ncbi:hypothetical protein [Streptomyces sp.]|uniref:hypothetical protein n=1 Tax=Streptomyces sp. TaxID=1931 RepID=UPI002D787642|nr:hypothetical protein [Streptomyces sp.]HET6358913.1 hypothetical protein [Streptomyces sp.]
MKSRAHAAAGVLAFVLITLFATVSVVAEILGDQDTLALAKTINLQAMPAFVGSMAVAVISGHSLATARQQLSQAQRHAPLVWRKWRRTAAAAAFGLPLVPCALILRSLAAIRDFGTLFVAVQAVELLVSAVIITILGLNVRDGRLLSASRRSRTGSISNHPAAHRR